MSQKNRYPIYIISKGRYLNNLTSKVLDKMNQEHYIVVESQEYELYCKHTNAKVLILPVKYQLEYDTCDNITDKPVGAGAPRNFCIDHSKALGYSKHWVMDDNIDAFHYMNRNDKVEVECNATIRAAEDFVDRYSNVPLAGFNYYSFAKKTDAVPPFIVNTRIYSCILFDNTFNYRWRARYNEDTDISLRVLKDGLCTIQFNAFLQGKVTTQRMAGGNTEVFYKEEGTLPKSQMLAELHPDVAKVVWRFNRWHHHVDYSSFKNNKLIKKDNLKTITTVNNYGMILKIQTK